VIDPLLETTNPKWNKLAEKISQKNPEYVKLLIAM
jgi:hypothetical protein